MTDIENFPELIIRWWKSNHRHFPWRMEDVPYKILIAEVLLHRTRAKNVASVYEEFIQRYPNLMKLGTADRDDVMDILKPLGLKWRVESLIEMTIIIATKFDGKIPCRKEELLTLPGVGDYIASALRVFAWGKTEPLIDTNTVRIISRIYNRKENDSFRKGRSVRIFYKELVGKADPKQFGYAMLDLASLLCLPKEPDCMNCSLAHLCETGKTRIG